MQTTIDDFLNHQIQLEQPSTGYRIAIDSLLLAAFMRSHNGVTILDLGCGVGGASIPLTFRLSGLSIHGLEIQPELVNLCHTNIARNPLKSPMEVTQGDLCQHPNSLANRFDQVMMNPPYHDLARHDVSANTVKRIADSESASNLADWITMANFALHPQGTLTVILRSDRQGELTDLLQEHGFGDVIIKTMIPKTGKPAKRLLARATKGTLFSVRNLPALVLHKDDGRYTDQVEKVLREAAELPDEA